MRDYSMDLAKVAAAIVVDAVSYTHLDVYKRQALRRQMTCTVYFFTRYLESNLISWASCFCRLQEKEQLQEST